MSSSDWSWAWAWRAWPAGRWSIRSSSGRSNGWGRSRSSDWSRPSTVSSTRRRAAVVAEIASLEGLRFDEVEVPQLGEALISRGCDLWGGDPRRPLQPARRRCAAPAGRRTDRTRARCRARERRGLSRQTRSGRPRRRVPVVPVAAPYGSPRWAILRWHSQFRKSKGLPATARYLGSANMKAHLLPEWFGPSVTFARVAGEVEPDWDSLVAEIRSSGARAPRK